MTATGTDPTVVAVRPSTPNAQVAQGTFTGSPDGRPRTLRHKTPYNWVELIYQAFGRSLPTGSKEVALLVLREASLGGTGEAAAKERRAAAGAGPTAAIGRTVLTDKVAFDDLLYLVWTEGGASQKQCVEVFRCTADPGSRGKRPTAMQIEGFFYSCTPVSHRPDKYGSALNALRIRNLDNTAMIRIARDARRNYNVYTHVESAYVPPTWRFCGDERHDSVGVNMHFGGALTRVGGWSIGCTALAWSRSSTRYAKDFFARCNTAPNRGSIPYLVVSSKYVKTFDAWRAEETDGDAKPWDVIRTDGLEPMPAGIPGYLPSFATRGFCEQVAEAARREGGPRGANLLASLRNLAITRLQAPLSTAAP